jgi:hypothetical protein
MHKFARSSAMAALSGSLMLMAWLLVSETAQARDYLGGRTDRIVLAWDFDYSATLSNDLFNRGVGGAMRVGNELEYTMITVTPEVLVDYHTFGTYWGSSAQLFTGKLGGRVRFLRAVEPGVFVHVGVGSLGGDSRYSHTSVVFDVGASLDFTFVPVVDLGFHVSWNRINGGENTSISYAASGVHLAFAF